MCIQQNSIQNWTQYVQYATRQFDWQFSFPIQLTIRPYNSAYNSALQFVLSISSDEFVLSNSTYDWPYNFGWPKWVKRSERPSSDSTVVQSGCFVSRPSLADVSRIGRSNGRVTRGKDCFWWHFSVDRFPIMDYPRGPSRPHWTENAGAGGFIPTRADLLMCTCAYACIYA